MKYKNQLLVMFAMVSAVTLVQCIRWKDLHHDDPPSIADGKHIFRYDAFGDEAFWSGLLHIDKAIAGAANSGFGPAFAPGIGKRLEGWPNRDLDVGGIISLTDNAQPIAGASCISAFTESSEASCR